MLKLDPKKFRKQTRVQKLEQSIELFKELDKTKQIQLNSSLELNKKLIEKLAAIGIKTKISRQGVDFEAVSL